MSDSVPTGGQWLTDTVSANTGLVSMAIFRALEVYHKATQQKVASERDKEQVRKLRLDALYLVVSETLRLGQTATGAAQLGVLVRYGALCLKRAKGIEAAQARLGKVRAVFGPSYAGNATARAAQRAGFTAKPKMLSSPLFWLEKLDPLHHSWRQPEVAALYAQWEADQSTTLGLWEWLEKNGTPAAVQLAERVVYLAPDRQWENACCVGEDGLVHKLASSAGVQGDVLWTSRANSAALRPVVFYHPQFWAYVISPAGRLYLHSHVADTFHHSSLLAGGRVLGAGMIGISRGRVVYMNNKSGHYTPTPAEFFKAIKLWRQFEPRLNLSGTLIEVIHGGHNSYLAWGDDWQSLKGDMEQLIGPFATSDKRTDFIGALRFHSATLIERGQVWADTPADRDRIARVTELAFSPEEGRSESGSAIPGSREWVKLRAQGFRTEAEQPRWFF